MPAGSYVLSVTVTDATGEQIGEDRFEIEHYADLLEESLEALSDAAAQIKTKARMQDDAHLALRSLDIDIRKAEAVRLIQEEDEERALAYVAQAKAITDMLLQGKVPPRSSSHALLRLTGDLSAETVIETWKSELGVGIYDAGIPLATLWKRSFAFTEEVAESLQEALEWWEKEELRITETTLGGHVIHLGSDDHRAVGMLTRGKKLYRVRAVSEEAAVALLDKVVSLDPGHGPGRCLDKEQPAVASYSRPRKGGRERVGVVSRLLSS